MLCSEIRKKLALLESSFEEDPNNPEMWSEEDQIKFILQNPFNIVYFKNPKEQLQRMAVERDSRAIGSIRNPLEAIQMLAVLEDPLNIKRIGHPTEAVQLAAVRAYGPSIGWISDPSEEVQMEALQQNLKSIEYIENPSPFVKILSQFLDDDHMKQIPKHQLMAFVEEALKRSKKYPFLLNVLKERGWI